LSSTANIAKLTSYVPTAVQSVRLWCGGCRARWCGEWAAIRAASATS